MNHITSEAIGFAGFATNVAGNLLLTRKNKHGWWVRIVSNALWLMYGSAASLPVMANAIVFTGINIWGGWAWRKERA